MNLRLNHVVIAAALIVGSVSAVIVAGADEFGVPSVSLCLVCVAVVSTLLWWEWRRDRRAAAMFLVFFSGVGLVISGVMAALVQPSVGVVVAAIISLSATAWLARVLWQESRFRDLVPSRLDQEFPNSPMFEDNGVQWTFGRAAALTSPPQVEVRLQNNIEATRTVELMFKQESELGRRTSAMDIADCPKIELAARAGALVTLPCRWNPKRKDREVRLYCFVRAKGQPAPRNRRKRAAPGPRPISKWLVVLAPIAGHIVTRRGGVQLLFARPEQIEESAEPLVGKVQLLGDSSLPDTD